MQLRFIPTGHLPNAKNLSGMYEKFEQTELLKYMYIVKAVASFTFLFFPYFLFMKQD